MSKALRWGIRFQVFHREGRRKQIINSKAKLFSLPFFRCSRDQPCYRQNPRRREAKVVKIVGKHKFVCFWLCLNTAFRLYALTSMKAIAIGELSYPCNKSCMSCVCTIQGIEFCCRCANVCVEKTFQLSWLIIKLFSLSLDLCLCSIFQRHITALISNNNIDFNSKIYSHTRNLFSLETSLGPLTQWIVVSIETSCSEGEREQKIRCTI